tara:strand:- start:30 stop:305 length:276 start_codon:yes stop_codon:yes gene_type:complete
MALTEEIVEDKIEIVGEYKNIQVRTATVIKRDGVELTRSFHRHVLQPSTKTDDSWAPTNVTAESTEVQAICAAVWTDDIRSAFQTMSDTQG